MTRKTARITIRTDPDDDEYLIALKDSAGKPLFRNLSEGYRFAVKYVRMFASAEDKERRQKE